jgi:hypothetical protein
MTILTVGRSAGTAPTCFALWLQTFLSLSPCPGRLTAACSYSQVVDSVLHIAQETLAKRTGFILWQDSLKAYRS